MAKRPKNGWQLSAVACTFANNGHTLKMLDAMLHRIGGLFLDFYFQNIPTKYRPSFVHKANEDEVSVLLFF